MPHAISPGDLRDTAVSRVLLRGGASGARIERLTFGDGTSLVVKSFDPGLDWMMRATGDSGRAAELWTSGAMDRLPASIDPSIVRIEREGPGWRLYMRDVTGSFLRARSRVPLAEVTRLLHAVAEMHEPIGSPHPPARAGCRTCSPSPRRRR